MASALAIQTLIPPCFATVEEERKHRKTRLAACLRVLADLGLDDGIAGHVTVRDPERPDCFWVNPLGIGPDAVRSSDLVLVNERGTVIRGGRPINTAALAVHAPIHAARPDVLAVVHAHPVHGRAWAALGRLLDPICQEACQFYEDHSLYDCYSGLVVDLDQGRRVAEVLGGNKAVILQNHGLITVGASVDAAAWWLIAFERCCRIQLLAEAAGEPRRIDHEQALKTRHEIGNDLIGWLSFQPLYQRIAKEQPDLFD